MSVGVVVIGREITLSFGGATLLGTISKNRTFNNEKIDTTDDAAAGWVESAATAGLKSVEFTFSGIVKNLELVAAYFGTSQIFPVIETFPDGSTLTYDVFLDSISQTGESNQGVTFDASCSSSGAVVFVAGV
jgi:predicted secreted protein